MKLITLGVGSSAGTPVIGCKCNTCISTNPKNKRSRCSSAILMPDGQVVLIDTGPDLRFQSLREGLDRVDAVLYTHTHADHVHGIDDLRSFCQLLRKQIPLYGNQETMTHILNKFSYAIRNPGDYWDLPVLSANPVESDFELFGETIIPIPVKHGRSEIYGYRIRNLAYITDVSEIPEASFSLLEGLDTLLLDCLRYVPHFSHINLKQSLAYASRINAKNTYLIHMTHDMEYDRLTRCLPPSIHVAYDGLELCIN